MKAPHRGRTAPSPTFDAARPVPKVMQAALGLVALGFFLIRLRFADIPLERDEGLYIYMAKLLWEGAVPYVDFFDVKLPGLHYSYALLYAIAGGNLVALHVLFNLLNAGCIVLVHRLGRRWLAGDGAALVAAVAFASLSLSAHAMGFTMQSEHLILCFMLAGVLLLERGLDRSSAMHLVAAGALICWAATIKQSAAFFGVFAAMQTVMRTRRSGAKPLLMALGPLGAGAVAVLALQLLATAMQGGLGELLFWTGEAAKVYSTLVPWADAPELAGYTVSHLFREDPLTWSLAGAGVLALMGQRPPASHRCALLLFLFMSVLTVVPGARFLGHYFLMLFPALALMVGAGSLWIARMVRGKRPAGAGWCAVVPAALLFAWCLANNANYYFLLDHTSLLRRVYHVNPFPEAKQVADLINARKQPGDRVLVVGAEVQIHLYTGTRSPSRFVFMSQLVQDHPAVPPWQQEWLRDALTAEPRFVVWVQHVGSWMPAPGVDQSFLETYWNHIIGHYDIIAWLEQDPPLHLNVVTGDAARSYQPVGQLFMFLAQRKPTAAAGNTP